MSFPADTAGGMCPRCLLSGLLDSRPDPVLGEREGDAVGPYELIELLGEGGMGSVWRARQGHPVEREVALKIIRLGMNTREVVSRFESERQSLAAMDHPGIARIYDAGATAEGRPYFAMELVEGLPVTDYCASRNPGLEERLRLFMEICAAVEHAHRKGVIHRDLKPSNVLVAESPDGPRPKVIDFGIAKTFGPEADGRTFVTRAGHAIGTPGYMSPEQAGAAPDVDTRADVYSLGALLYAMLTGCPPLGKETFRGAAYAEVMRLIRETDPPRPSTRAADRAESRSPLRIARDLDRIVMTALARERERRYGGAAALSEDLRRFLAHEPVSARDPTLGYRVGKFVRKHRLPVALSGLLVLGLVLATVLVAREAGRARLSAQREKAARLDTLGALADAYRNRGLTASIARDDAQAALWFERAASLTPHDPERARANRLRANLHAARALVPVRVFGCPTPVGTRMEFDETSSYLHEGGFGVPHRFYDLERGEVLDFGFKLKAGRLLPGGTLAAVSDGGPRVEIRDLATMIVVESFEVPDGGVSGIWSNADGSRLAVGTECLHLWDRKSRTFAEGTLPHPRPIRYARFSPDDQWVLTVDSGLWLRVFPAVGRDPAQRFEPLFVDGVAGFLHILPDFRDDSRELLVQHDSILQIIRADSGEVTEEFPMVRGAFDLSAQGGLYSRFNGVFECPSGILRFSSPIGPTYFLKDDASVLGTGTGEILDLGGTLLDRVPVPGGPHAFSPDGTLLAIGHDDCISIHQLARPEPLRRIAFGGSGRIASTDDGRLFASAGMSGGYPTATRTRAFRVSDGQPVGPEIDTGFQHLSAAFLVATAHLVTGGRVHPVSYPGDHRSPGGAGVVQLWDVRSGERLAGPLELPGEPWAMLQHPSEGWIAVLCREGSLLKLAPDLSGYEEILHLQLELGSDDFDRTPGHLVFSPDGSRLFANGFNSIVWAIDPEEKKVVYQTAERHGRVLRLELRDGVLFSPTLSADDPWLFQASDGTPIPLASGLQPAGASGSRLSDGGELLLSGPDRVAVVDLKAGAAIGPGLHPEAGWSCYSEFVGGTPWVLSAVSSETEKATLMLWDRRTGMELGPRWPLRSRGIVDFVTLLDGRRAVLSVVGEGFVIVDLDAIRSAEEWRDGFDEAGRLQRAELRAGRRFGNGSPVPMDSLLAAWNDFRSRHPDPIPLRPDREALLQWHRNQEAIHHHLLGDSARWHRERIEALEAAP